MALHRRNLMLQQTVVSSVWKWVLAPLLALLCFNTIALPVWATGVYNMPSLSAGSDTWVVDDADILSRLSENRLSTLLSDLAAKTGKETRVVTLHRLDYGETIESFTESLFKNWFPTPETQANQILLVLDDVTNNSAIRTGEAVKTDLADPIAESIAQETLMVPVRKGSYNQAFLDAVDRLSLVLSGEPDPGPPVVTETIQVEGTFSSAEETEKNRSNSLAWVIGLLIAATVIPMATYYLYLFLQSQA